MSSGLGLMGHLQARMQTLPTYLPTYLLALKKKIQRDYLVLLFCNTETTAGLPVLKGIFFKLFTAQTRLGFTASNKHYVADPETSKT